jgi:hypothetical protein
VPKPATKRRLPTRQLIYPFILSSAVASLAINLKNAREEYRLLESRHAAQMSVLDETISKLGKGIRISDADLKRDYERVGLLQRDVYVKAERIGWREMLFGKKKSETDLAAERQEMKDLEEGKSTCIPGAEMPY